MKKILVIEDNTHLRENIVEILELEGFETIAAQNGKVGIDLAIEELPDLIVSDINMPEVDGYGVLEKLRSLEETRTIPFIFLTVKNTLQDVRSGMNLGADDYLPKPFDLVELTQIVHKRLKMREEIIARENEKYDKLKNAVGLPIANLIDSPLKNIEKLTEFLFKESNTLDSTEISEIASIVNKSAAKLRKEIIKILFFYRIEALKNNEGELSELKELITENASEQIEKISKEVASEFKRDSDLFVHLDESSIQFPEEFLDFSIKELVENAFKYSAKNCPVKISGTNEGNQYKVTIQDKGIGFANDNLEDIQPYEKLSGGTTNDGLGLGLYDVTNLVKLFDGQIELVSEEGIGTSLTLSFKA